MNEHEIARRANALPDQFATRLADRTLKGLRLMSEGGEHGELVLELSAALLNSRAETTAEELEELRSLLEAMDMPTDPLQHLTVGLSQ